MLLNLVKTVKTGLSAGNLFQCGILDLYAVQSLLTIGTLTVPFMQLISSKILEIDGLSDESHLGLTTIACIPNRKRWTALHIYITKLCSFENTTLQSYSIPSSIYVVYSRNPTPTLWIYVHRKQLSHPSDQFKNQEFMNYYTSFFPCL